MLAAPSKSREGDFIFLSSVALGSWTITHRELVINPFNEKLTTYMDVQNIE